jgi:protein-disulfide isomerase
MSRGEKSFSIPIALGAAVVIIGSAIYFAYFKSSETAAAPAVPKVETYIPPVTADDHIYGDPAAPIKIVEYVDFDSSFSKSFDATMKDISVSYSGKVAWVLRNFPLQESHPGAPRLALAAECVASLSGNDAYWKFKDALFEASPSEAFDPALLTHTAISMGIDGKAFDTCIASGEFAKRVNDEFNQAVAAGALGSPYSVLITEDGAQAALPGAQPEENLKAAIDAALGT